MITRTKKIDGIYYPQIMFKLFGLLPTGWWRCISDFQYDVIDGKYVDVVFFVTEQEANNYLNKDFLRN